MYEYNEELAIKKFMTATYEYGNTNNKEARKHWEELRNEIIDGTYTIIHNTDFLGIRMVV